MKSLSIVLVACLLPACVTRSSSGDTPEQGFASYDYVKVLDFEVGDVSYLPLSDQMTLRNLAGMLGRQVHLELYRRGMLTGKSGRELIIKGKIASYDPGQWSVGQSAVFLSWVSPFPPPFMGLPLPWPIFPIFPPLLPSKAWGFATTGGLVLETSFSDRDGTVVATGTAEVDVSTSTAGGDVIYAARDLAASIADYVAANY